MHTGFVDFHSHTTLSDGALDPQALIDNARQAGIRTLAITDHNHTEKLTALQAANPDIRLIQGAEISCTYTTPSGRQIQLHVVALGFDPENGDIRRVLAHNQPDRKPYVQAILARLRALDIHLGDYESLMALSPDSRHIGRMHIARAMVARGYVPDVETAFDEYIGAFGKRRAFVEDPLQYVSLEEAIGAIRSAGGIPILAHLYYYPLDPGEQEALLVRFRQLAGEMSGMEVYYGLYTQEQREVLLELSRKHRLMASCASDYHGQNPEETLDHRFSPGWCEALLDALRLAP